MAMRLPHRTSGQPIGADVPFQTATFSALLRNAGSKQEIEIKVDAGSPRGRWCIRSREARTEHGEPASRARRNNAEDQGGGELT
ncbi:MAG: hypothetical protein ACR2G6_09310 [Gemmatimonadaceae bacterium]